MCRFREKCRKLKTSHEQKQLYLHSIQFYFISQYFHEFSELSNRNRNFLRIFHTLYLKNLNRQMKWIIKLADLYIKWYFYYTTYMYLFIYYSFING